MPDVDVPVILSAVAPNAIFGVAVPKSPNTNLVSALASVVAPAQTSVDVKLAAAILDGVVPTALK